ncbi:MAG: peptidoglycan-binding domain-containing protein [Minisyncoccia bacterium]
MSKLLKSKFLLGVLVVATLFVGFAFNANSAAADCSITTTLRAGSVGTEVQCLQTIIGATADGKFGPMTKAAVMAWQAGHGLVADGVVGAMTRAALMGAPTGNFPAGCTSASGYSATTGVKCDTGASAGLPAGCSSTVGYSQTTGVKCDGSQGGSSSGPLSGGAGDVTITSTTSDVEDTVKEDDTEVKVLGFQVEAEDSDVEINNVKVLLKNTGFGPSSENLLKYVDEVSIMMGDEVVGSADTSDFSKDSGSPDEFTKSISLDNAVVREGDKVKFYVAVTTSSTIDTADMTDADWYVLADTLRFEDGSGVVSTTDITKNNTFDFEDASSDDSLEVKSSTANPEDGTVKVDENNTTDDVLALQFKLDVDEDSADASVTSATVKVAVSNFDYDKSGVVDAGDLLAVANGDAIAWADRIVDSLMVEIDGEEFEADLDNSDGTSGDLAAGAGYVYYTVDFDDDEMVISSGDVVDVKVLINFNDQGDDTVPANSNYNEGVVVTASLAATTDISAETENDEITVDGSSKTGADLTLNLSEATLSSLSWVPLEGGAGVELRFTVEAEGDAVLVTLADLVAADTVTTTGTVAAPTLTKVSGDAVEAPANTWTIDEGDTASFSLVYTNTGANATSVRVTMPTIAGQDVSDDKEVSPLVVRNVN